MAREIRPGAPNLSASLPRFACVVTRTTPNRSRNPCVHPHAFWHGRGGPDSPAGAAYWYWYCPSLRTSGRIDGVARIQEVAAMRERSRPWAGTLSEIRQGGATPPVILNIKFLSQLTVRLFGGRIGPEWILGRCLFFVRLVTGSPAY